MDLMTLGNLSVPVQCITHVSFSGYICMNFIAQTKTLKVYRVQIYVKRDKLMVARIKSKERAQESSFPEFPSRKQSCNVQVSFNIETEVQLQA